MTEEPSSTVEKGRVISQEPMAGTLQTQQSPIIQIKVSSGPMLVKMPDIIGFTQDNASRLLDAEGIPVPHDADGKTTAAMPRAVSPTASWNGKTLKKGRGTGRRYRCDHRLHRGRPRRATTPVPPEALAQDAQE